MEERVFDRETLLDLTVNFVPLGILVFFVALFAIINPFGWNTTYSILQYALVIVPFVALAVLTYLSGKAISKDEKRREAEETMESEADVHAADERVHADADAAEGEDADAAESDEADAAESEDADEEASVADADH